MKRVRVAIGVLVTVVVAVSIGLGAGRLSSGGGYELTADFASVGGLRPHAPVEIAGVPIGTVAAISLRHDEAHVALHLDATVRVPADSSAVIKTEGLMGQTYVALQPGSAGTALAPGGRIQRTVSAIELEDAIAAKIFGQIS